MKLKLICIGLLISTFATAAKTPPWQSKMKSLAATMGELLPELVARDPDKKILEKGAKQLSELSHSLQKKSASFTPPPDADPSIQIIAGVFAREAKRGYVAIRRGQVQYGRNLLRNVTSYCIACHTRNDSGPEFPTFPINPKARTLGRVEKAELLTATRQFDKAFTEFQGILNDSALARAQQLDWDRAVRNALSIAVRVKKSPSMAEDVILRVLAEPTTPQFMKETAKQWKETVTKWKAEPAVSTVTEDQIYGEVQRLFKEARELQKYPADHSADILYLRASARAHDLLAAAPKGGRAAEALFLAGSAYEALNDPSLWPVHELYYEACVRTAPHTATSGECFRRYEESIYFGYSGSGGVSIPEDVQKELTELRALSVPET